ncbi:MAG: hypothetical protein ACREB9_04540, partial [Thermoplasmata archaeon]
LTVGANLTFSLPTLSGAGTLSVSSTFTLTVGANLTASIAAITVAGTFALGTNTVTVPVDSTVSFSVTGTVSGTGTLTTNGTLYWVGVGVSASTTNAQAAFAYTLSGTGVALLSPAGAGTASTALTETSAAIPANSAGASGGGSTNTIYYEFSSQVISGSAVGKYTLGDRNESVNTYRGFLLIYIGTASTNYTVSGSFGIGNNNVSGDAIYVYNMSGSAGTITISCTMYI